MRRVFDLVTFIPPARGPGRLSAPNGAARFLRSHLDRGFGRRLATEARRAGARILSTYFAQAVAADALGVEEVWCLTTDSDVNRVWVPEDAARSRIRYLVPFRRTGRRLRAYGVSPERIHVTGFPLPPSLLGGPDLPTLRRHLAARLLRLDPGGEWRRGAPEAARSLLALAATGASLAPPRVTFAVGGAGAQSGLAAGLVAALREALDRGALRLTLVAGVRRAATAALLAAAASHAPRALASGALEVLHDATFDGYVRRFDACLAETDVLWTKPSELVFYGALGLPVVLAPPLGFHERRNGALARRRGFGLPMPRVADAARWLEAALRSGDLARAAWAGYARMPKHGSYRIAEAVRGEGD
jgi:hypothetical protein